jgi:hypothetical protein
MVLDDEDFLQIDIESALDDYRAGKLSQAMVYDTLRELGLSDREIAPRVYDAMGDKWNRRVRDFHRGEWS